MQQSTQFTLAQLLNMYAADHDIVMSMVVWDQSASFVQDTRAPVTARQIAERGGDLLSPSSSEILSKRIYKLRFEKVADTELRREYSARYREVEFKVCVLNPAIIASELPKPSKGVSLADLLANACPQADTPAMDPNHVGGSRQRGADLVEPPKTFTIQEILAVYAAPYLQSKFWVQVNVTVKVGDSSEFVSFCTTPDASSVEGWVQEKKVNAGEPMRIVLGMLRAIEFCQTLRENDDCVSSYTAVGEYATVNINIIHNTNTSVSSAANEDTASGVTTYKLDRIVDQYASRFIHPWVLEFEFSRERESWELGFEKCGLVCRPELDVIRQVISGLRTSSSPELCKVFDSLEHLEFTTFDHLSGNTIFIASEGTTTVRVIPQKVERVSTTQLSEELATMGSGEVEVEHPREVSSNQKSSSMMETIISWWRKLFS